MRKESIMRMLTKTDFSTRKDLRKGRVEIPEWDGFVYVSEMSADARDEYEQYVIAESEKKKSEKAAYIHIRAALAAASITDDKGKRLFTFADCAALGEKSGQILDRIFNTANRLNKIYGQESEDVAKNSQKPQVELQDGE